MSFGTFRRHHTFSLSELQRPNGDKSSAVLTRQRDAAFLLRSDKKGAGDKVTGAPAPDLQHASVCPSCESGFHGEHSDAVAFGLLQCDCRCHSPTYVPGPRAMSRHLSALVVRVDE
jgi:hypothetical protein